MGTRRPLLVRRAGFAAARAAGTAVPLSIRLSACVLWFRRARVSASASRHPPLATRCRYEMLDRTAHRLAVPSSRRFVAVKLFLEMVALHPMSLTAFFFFVGLGSGETLKEVRCFLPPRPRPPAPPCRVPFPPPFPWPFASPLHRTRDAPFFRPVPSLASPLLHFAVGKLRGESLAQGCAIPTATATSWNLQLASR